MHDGFEFVKTIYECIMIHHKECLEAKLGLILHKGIFSLYPVNSSQLCIEEQLCISHVIGTYIQAFMDPA